MTDDIDRADLSADEARALTDRIKADAETLWGLITEAYLGRAWIALGYKTWDVYCIKEFGSTRLRLPREERTEMVASLRQSGLSIRAIASATGAAVGTIHREVEAGAAARAIGVPNRTPAAPVDEPQTDDDADRIAEELIIAEVATIIGTDGKTYPPPHRRRRRRLTVVQDRSPNQRKPDTPQHSHSEIPFVLQLRSIRRDLDTLMDLAKTLDADAKRKVLNKHRENIEFCVAKMAAVAELFAEFRDDAQ
jgi:transposase-like protein